MYIRAAWYPPTDWQHSHSCFQWKTFPLCSTLTLLSQPPRHRICGLNPVQFTSSSNDSVNGTRAKIRLQELWPSAVSGTSSRTSASEAITIANVLAAPIFFSSAVKIAVVSLVVAQLCGYKIIVMSWRKPYIYLPNAYLPTAEPQLRMYHNPWLGAAALTSRNSDKMAAIRTLTDQRRFAGRSHAPSIDTPAEILPFAVAILSAR